MMKITETVKQLIIINVLVYICSQFVPVAYNLLALHFPMNPDFQIWQFISYMFMHADIHTSSGITHILFNMLALWMFGSPLEHFWGTKRFLFFYFSCGVGAALFNLGIDYYSFYSVLNDLTQTGIDKETVMAVLSKGNIEQNAVQLNQWFDVVGQSGLEKLLLSYNSSMIGASGALYGITVAFAFVFPNAELMMLFLPIPIKAKYFVPLLLIFDLVMGLRGQALLGQGDGVAHFAHLGGAIVGGIIMLYWRNNRFNHNRWN